MTRAQLLPPPLDFSKRRPDCSLRAGRATAARYAHVVDGQLYTTSQIAARLGIQRDSVRKRIYNAPRPLTWAGIEGGKHGSK